MSSRSDSVVIAEIRSQESVWALAPKGRQIIAQGERGFASATLGEIASLGPPKSDEDQRRGGTAREDGGTERQPGRQVAASPLVGAEEQEPGQRERDQDTEDAQPASDSLLRKGRTMPKPMCQGPRSTNRPAIRISP